MSSMEIWIFFYAKFNVKYNFKFLLSKMASMITKEIKEHDAHANHPLHFISHQHYRQQGHDTDPPIR